MEETIGGVVFGMLLIQVMSMYDNSKRLDHLEQVIAAQMKGSMILSETIESQLEDQKNYRMKAMSEIRSQHNETLAHLDLRSSDRITRTEVVKWRDELADIVPWVPPIPRINSPHFWYSPLIPDAK